MSDPTNRRKTDLASPAPKFSLSMTELTAVLVQHYGLPKGRYELGIEFQIGVGPVASSSQQQLPGVILGVKSIGLSPVTPEASDPPSEVASSEEAPPAPKKARSRKTEKTLD